MNVTWTLFWRCVPFGFAQLVFFLKWTHKHIWTNDLNWNGWARVNANTETKQNLFSPKQSGVCSLVSNGKIFNMINFLTAHSVTWIHETIVITFMKPLINQCVVIPTIEPFNQSLYCNFPLKTFRPINALFQRRNKSTSSLFSSLSFLFSSSLFSFLFVVVNLPAPAIRL